MSRNLLVNDYTFNNFDDGRFRPMNNLEIILSHLMTCFKDIIKNAAIGFCSGNPVLDEIPLCSAIRVCK